LPPSSCTDCHSNACAPVVRRQPRCGACNIMILEKAARRRHRTEFAASEFVVEILRSEGAAQNSSSREENEKALNGGSAEESRWERHAPRKSSGNLSPAHPQRHPEPQHPHTPLLVPVPARITIPRALRCGIRAIRRRGPVYGPIFHAPGAESEGPGREEGVCAVGQGACPGGWRRGFADVGRGIARSVECP
jgi:hypothetical protein